jgi:hypothetical protein
MRAIRPPATDFTRDPSCFAVLALSLVRGRWGHADGEWFVDLGV